MIADFLLKVGNNPVFLDIILAVIFILLISYFLYRNRKSVKLEKILFPVLYAFLYRGKFGINWMEKKSKKHKESLKLFGYISIGFGFIGMIAAIFLILFVAFQLIFKPRTASVAPFLPFVDVPILGYISFSHWIITIFVIVLIHEAAHGLVALAHGLKIKSTGFGVFAIFAPLLPAAFVEPDEKKIEKQPDVVQYSIFAAGPISNFVLMIPLLLILLFIINPIESQITNHNGFTFDVIQNSDYPAYTQGINNGTIFNSLNGIKVISVDEFYIELQGSGPNQNIVLAYYDDFEEPPIYSYELTLIENPDNSRVGFLGVIGLRNSVEIKQFALPFAPFFSWFKGLIMLMFDITFSLGLINLFPASITDGGRMFNLALSRISQNKKLNKIIVSSFAIFFLVIIFFALITFFTGNPFTLFFG